MNLFEGKRRRRKTVNGLGSPPHQSSITTRRLFSLPQYARSPVKLNMTKASPYVVVQKLPVIKVNVINQIQGFDQGAFSIIPFHRMLAPIASRGCFPPHFGDGIIYVCVSAAHFDSVCFAILALMLCRSHYQLVRGKQQVPCVSFFLCLLQNIFRRVLF